MSTCRTRAQGGIRLHGRRGMTLVELLVVTGLLAMLIGLTVVGARRGPSRPTRAADDLVSMLISAQSRALNVPEGAAVILTMDSGTMTSGTAAAPATTSGTTACTQGYDAEMLPFIRASGSFTFLTLNSATARLSLVPSTGDDLQRAYKILFLQQYDPGAFGSRDAPSSAWMAFAGSNVGGGPAFSGTASFRAELGQTSTNTVWPRTAAGSLTFSALLGQCPKPSSSAASFAADAAVDLRFSGIGDRPADHFNRGGSVAVAFDRSGRVAEVLYPVTDPDVPPYPPQGSVVSVVPVSPIYFLVAAKEMILSGSNTLASAEATWVTVSPQTGRVIQSPNVVQSGTDAAALYAARARARQLIGVAK